MGVIDIEGFNGYDSANMSSKFTGPDLNIGASETISSTFARTGTTSLKVDNNGNYCTRIIKNDAGTVQNLSTIVVGFGLLVVSSSANGIVLALTDSVGYQVEIYMNSSGQLYITRNGTTIVSAGTTSLAANTWYYIELKVFVSATVGTAELRINRVLEISGTGLNTKQQTNAYVNAVAFVTAPVNNGSWVHYYSDFYVTDGNFLGPLKIYVKRPTAEGTHTDMTPSTGTDNSLLVDDPTPNTTDYVSTTAAGNVDTYVTENNSAAGTIAAVKQNIFAQDAASVLSVAGAVLCNGGATLSIGSGTAAQPAYGYKERVLELEPGSGLPWTDTSFNAAEFGQKSL